MQVFLLDPSFGDIIFVLTNHDMMVLSNIITIVKDVYQFSQSIARKKENIITTASQNNYIQFKGVNQSIVASGSAYTHVLIHLASLCLLVGAFKSFKIIICMILYHMLIVWYRSFPGIS